MECSYIASGTVKWCNYLTCKTVWQFLKMINRVITWPSSFVPGEVKTYAHKKNCTQMFIALFLIAKKWKRPKCLSTDEWINEVCYIHAILFSHKRNEVVIYTTIWTNFEIIMLGSQTQKATYCLILFTWHVLNRQIHWGRK